jgi:DNA-binding transcriptional LysR family regulator
MELAWLADFQALASALNFSRAAEMRHVTQPAFSRRIRALEHWVGTDLFTRSTHGVALTPAGERFRAHADAVVRALEQARRDARDAAGLGSKLTIAATHALSFTFFPKWIRGTADVLSLGNLNLISDSMQACEQMLVRGETQFLLCHDRDGTGARLDPRQFTSISVGSDVLIPLSAPTKAGKPRWPLHRRTPAKYLAYSPQSGLGRIVAARWDANAAPFALDPLFASPLAATLLSMARAGEGVAWLPRTLAEDDIASGRLVPAGKDDAAIAIDVRLFRPVARQSPTVETAWAAFARDAAA